MPAAAAITETPAQSLARKIARIESLRAENAADAAPMFVALLARWTALAPIEGEGR